MIAYIVATCIPGQEKDAISKIKKIPNIVEVNPIMGRYDIFVKVSAKKEQDLHASIIGIRDVQEISSTATFAVIRGQGGTIDEEAS